MTIPSNSADLLSMRLRDVSRAACAIVFLALLFLPALAGAGERRAVIIGVGAYEFWPALSGPPREAQALARVLTESYGYAKENVDLLTDAPGADILAALDRAVKACGKDDSLLVFFSGRSGADNTGDIYWIPRDGRSESREGWLSFSTLTRDYFASPRLAALSLLLLCDSPVKPELTVQKPNPLSVNDLRYAERVLDRSRRKSRELIFSGAPYRAGDESTDGMGSFAFRVVKALSDNDMETADAESLLFSPFLPTAGLAGPPLMRGRFKASPDAEGQFVLLRSAVPQPAAPAPAVAAQPSPPEEPKGIRVVSASVSPNKGPVGGVYRFSVETREPAARVTIRIGTEKTAMSGSGRRWSLEKRIERAGSFEFSVAAADASGVFGPVREGLVTVGVCQVKVVRTSVSPAIGYSGSEFTVTAATDRAASAAFLWLDGERIPMTGSGAAFHVSRAMSGESLKTYKVTAVDRYGAESAPLSGKVMFLKPPGVPDVAALSVRPRSVAPGDAFIVEARASEPAARITLKMGDRTVLMDGGPVSFTYRGTWNEPGSVSILATAENQSGVKGAPRRETLAVVRAAPAAPPVPPPPAAPRQAAAPDTSGRPAAIEKVTARPDTVGVDQPVLFTAKVSGAMSRVTVSIEGVDQPMHAESATLWTLTKRFQTFGPKTYTISGLGKDGTPTNSVDGAILVRAPVIKIVQSFLQPPTIRPGGDLTVIATTDREAAGVEVRLGDVVQAMEPMDSSRKKWRYSTTAPDPIPQGYKIVVKARNEEGRSGPAMIWTLNE